MRTETAAKSEPTIRLNGVASSDASTTLQRIACMRNDRRGNKSDSDLNSQVWKASCAADCVRKNSHANKAMAERITTGPNGRSVVLGFCRNATVHTGM